MEKLERTIPDAPECNPKILEHNGPVFANFEVLLKYIHNKFSGKRRIVHDRCIMFGNMRKLLTLDTGTCLTTFPIYTKCLLDT